MIMLPWKPEDPTPGNRVAAYVVVAVVLALLLALGIIVARCSRPEPPQMIVTPAPEVRATPAPIHRATAIATSSAQASGTQGIRIMGRRVARPQVTTPEASNGATDLASGAVQVTTPDDSWEWVIEASQSLTAATTSSAQASASVKDPDNMDGGNGRLLQDQARNLNNDHGRLGVIAATMPGLLAADLQLVRLDVSPLTRWLVGVDMEVGVDTIVNLDAVGSGVTVGSKAFVGIYGWNRWDMSAHGLAMGVGLRF